MAPTVSRLPPVEQALIEDMIKHGVPIKQIARQQNRSYRTVLNIRNNIRKRFIGTGTCISGSYEDMLEDLFSDELV